MRMSLSSPAKTKKAFEIHFGINHVTQAMLAQLLLPKLLDPKRAGPTADVRMHVTASMACKYFWAQERTQPRIYERGESWLKCSFPIRPFQARRSVLCTELS